MQNGIIIELNRDASNHIVRKSSVCFLYEHMFFFLIKSKQ